MRDQESQDKLLRQKMEGYEIAPPSYLWDNINDKLKEKRRPGGGMLYYLMPVAAVLALVTTWLVVDRSGHENLKVVEMVEQGSSLPSLKDQEKTNPRVSNRGVSERKLSTILSQDQGLAEVDVNLDQANRLLYNKKINNTLTATIPKPEGSLEPQDMKVAALTKYTEDPGRSDLPLQQMEMVYPELIVLENSYDSHETRPYLKVLKKPFKKKATARGVFFAGGEYFIGSSLPAVTGIKTSGTAEMDAAQLSAAPSRPEDTYSAGNTFTKKYGLAIGLHLKNNWSVRSGLVYSQMNTSYKSNSPDIVTITDTSTITTSSSVVAKQELRFLEIPLVARFQTGPSLIDFFAEAGPGLRINLLAKEARDITTTEETETYQALSNDLFPTSFAGSSNTAISSSNYSVSENTQQSDLRQDLNKMGLNFSMRLGAGISFLGKMRFEAGPTVHYVSGMKNSSLHMRPLSVGMSTALYYRF